MPNTESKPISALFSLHPVLGSQSTRLVAACLTPIWPGALTLASGAPSGLAPATSWPSAPAHSLRLRSQQYQPLLEMCLGMLHCLCGDVPGLSPLPSITQTQHAGPLLGKTAPLAHYPASSLRPLGSVHRLLSSSHPCIRGAVAPPQARGTQYRLAHREENERRRFQSNSELQACGRCCLRDFRWEQGTHSLRRQHSKILSGGS